MNTPEQPQVDMNLAAFYLSKQIQQMAIDHAVALASKDAEIAELRRQLVADMDAEEGDE